MNWVKNQLQDGGTGTGCVPRAAAGPVGVTPGRNMQPGPAQQTQTTQQPVHITFYSKAVKSSSKPFLSLALADRDASKPTLATSNKSGPGETGLTLGKAGALLAEPSGWKCSCGGRAVYEVRKDELCHCLNPSCCFSNEGSPFGHWRVPESVMRRGCSTADIPPSQGTAQREV